MRLTLIYIFLFVITGISPLFANDPSHAISMHGKPKHKADFSHLPYANPNAIKGGRLTHCSIGTFDTLNDNTMKGKPAEGLYWLNDPLMRRVWDEPFGLYGAIAKNVILAEDRSSITFLLNPNAQFHDGSPVTAEDVEFSFLTLKEKGKPNTQNVYALVDKVTIKDRHTINFTFGSEYNRETAMIIAMMPVYSKNYWENKEFDATTFKIPLGNGPYKIKSIDEGKKITYEKVTDYWAKDEPVNIGHYNFDEVVFDYYRDEQVALEAFKSGACDIRREANPAKWLVNYNDNEKYIMENLQHSRPEPTRGFIFNTRRAPLNDPDVRLALIKAFDFDWMNKTLFHNKAKRVDSTFSNSFLKYTPSIETNKNKREQLKDAAALLDKAGWPLKNGERFQLTLILNNPAEEKIALGYARDLKRLGIDFKIRTLDTAQFFGALTDYDFDMVSWRWINSLSPGTEQNVYWGCTAADTPGSRNYAGVCDSAIDETIINLTQAENYDELKKQAKLLDKLIMDKNLFIPLYYTGVDYVARWPYIHHPQTQSLYGMVLETWWKEK